MRRDGQADVELARRLPDEHDGGLGKEQQQLPMAVLAQLSENPELRAAALKIVTNMKVRLTLDQCPACGRKRQEQDLE